MSLPLSELVEAARDTTARQRAAVSEATLREEAEALGARQGGRGRFMAALQPAGVAVIAEIKGASPLRGSLRDDFDPVGLAAEYEDHGAAAISVLTEEHFFAGAIDHLESVSASVGLPTLRKDFVVELYQIFRAATAGAGAVLLIAELLEGSSLQEFVEAAHSVGLDALVEFHRPALLLRAIEAGSGLVGVNNRDLDTMEIDVEHALTIADELLPGIVTVAESAVSSPEDVRRIADAGYDAVLVGTALVTAEDPGVTLRELVDAGRADQAAEPDGEAGTGEAEAAAARGAGDAGRAGDLPDLVGESSSVAREREGT